MDTDDSYGDIVQSLQWSIRGFRQQVREAKQEIRTLRSINEGLDEPCELDLDFVGVVYDLANKILGNPCYYLLTTRMSPKHGDCDWTNYDFRLPGRAQRLDNAEDEELKLRPILQNKHRYIDADEAAAELARASEAVATIHTWAKEDVIETIAEIETASSTVANVREAVDTLTRELKTSAEE